MSSKIWQLAFVFLTVTAHLTFVTSQIDLNSFHECLNKGNYTSESSYRANLNTLLGSLSSNIGNSGFYNASIGEANAMALCRADIQLSECRSCINNTTEDILRLCPNQYQAIMWYVNCTVRYSNEPIFGKLATVPSMYMWNIFNGTNAEEFRALRRMLIDDLRAKAPNGGPLRKAAAGNKTTFPYNQTIYGLVQCTPDLSPDDCTSCLDYGITYIVSCCDTNAGFRFLMPSCTLRYELYHFVNITRFEEPLELPPQVVPAHNGTLQSPPSLPAQNGKNDGNRTRNIIIIVASIGAFLTLALSVGVIAGKKIKHKAKGDPGINEDGDEISSVESIQYDFGKIRAATDYFSHASKLGQGGFGAVYRGKLQNGREIAVKRLSWGSSQGDFEFKNEVLLVARLQHRNLVRLLGFSIQGNERLLVYEFVKNGSLDHVLFDPTKSSNLDWDTRYKIIGGIARGLLYLHEDSRLRIIHRDLKASNVLLDEEMNPKISDFGMAKLVMPDATQESTSRIVGTYGYMAPEYAIHGHISTKSDIFTFGVLVLEIVSGQKKISFRNGENSGDLLSYAWRSWREGTSANMIDPVLMANSGIAQQDILRCIHIALLCIQQNPENRPTMASVAVMLNSFSLTLP